jgi:cytochrome d ubiquinol oxidase subunit II
MGTIWYCLVAIMIAGYVVFDGFDLGAGIVHLLVAKTPEERRVVLGSIGPVWDGNEVWLLAAGGTLYFAFPALYASGFSGFYLPLMMVLWLLILRGIAIEFRNAVNSPVWIPFWDVVFCLASSLLAIFYGAALGNVVRGVPLDAHNRFFEPLWTNFRVGGETGVLDWYTVLIGLAAFLSLALHGALWVALKAEGAIHERALAVALRFWPLVAVFTVVITIATFEVQPQVWHNLTSYPLGFVFPVIALGGLTAAWWFLSRRNELRAFLASSAYLVGMLTSVVFGVYPYVLPSSTGAENALTIQNAKAADYGLRIGMVWWIIGMALATGYFVYSYRNFAGKVKAGAGHEGY